MDSMQLNYYGNKLIKKLQIVSQFKYFRDISRLKDLKIIYQLNIQKMSIEIEENYEDLK